MADLKKELISLKRRQLHIRTTYTRDLICITYGHASRHANLNILLLNTHWEVKDTIHTLTLAVTLITITKCAPWKAGSYDY